MIFVRGADISENLFRLFCKMCGCSRPMEIVTFAWKNGETPKLVVDFLLENTRSEKTWKSSKIAWKKVTTTTANPGNRRGFLRENIQRFRLFHFLQCFLIFLSLHSYYFHFFTFLFFFILFIFSCCPFSFLLFFLFFLFLLLLFICLVFFFRSGSFFI